MVGVDCNPMRLLKFCGVCHLSQRSFINPPPPLFWKRRNRQIGSDLPMNKLIVHV